MVIKGREVSFSQVGSGSNSRILDVPLLDPKGHSRKSEKIVILISLEGKIEKPSDALGSMGENCQTKCLGRMGFKKYFPFLKIFRGKISVEIDINKKPLDQSSPSEVCGPTLLTGMA